MSALDFFTKYFDDEVFALLVDMTNKYARQQRADDPERNKMKWDDVTVEEMRAYFGMCIIMGIIRLPSLNMYWTTDNLFVLQGLANVMPRDRFKQIKRYLHIADNTNAPNMNAPNYDKLWKVRELLEIGIPKLNTVYKSD